MNMMRRFNQIIQVLTNQNLIYITSIISLIYYTWATGQFFDKSRAVSYIKAFVSYLSGVIIFSFSITFVAVFIDIILQS